MARKILSVTLPFTILLVLPLSALAGGKISFRIYGGLSYLDAGDVNPGTQAFFDWGKAYFAPPPGGLIEGDYEVIHWGYELGGDAIFQLSPKLGIGIGVGYIRSSKEPTDHPWMMEIIDDPGGETTLIKSFLSRTKLSAIPLRLSFFLTLPLSAKFNFAANGGASYYLQPRYQATWFVEVGYSPGIPEHPSQTISTTADQNEFPIGFHGGLGIEYKFLSNAALFIEAEGRYAKFRGLEGTSVWEGGGYGGLFPPFSESGKLYYESVPAVPNEPRWIMVQSAPPAGPEGQPREAVVDFSGVSLLAGIKIRF